MATGDTVLSLTVLGVILTSIIVTSHKTGVTFYSIWSATKETPKYKVNTSKVPLFLALVIGVLGANLVFASLMTSDSEFVIKFSLFNTAFISYALAFWVLLEEKAKK